MLVYCSLYPCWWGGDSSIVLSVTDWWLSVFISVISLLPLCHPWLIHEECCDRTNEKLRLNLTLVYQIVLEKLHYICRATIVINQMAKVCCYYQ